MHTLEQIKKALGLEDTSTARIFKVAVTGNPYVEVAQYATADVQVLQLDGVCYVSTQGTIDAQVATQITE